MLPEYENVKYIGRGSFAKVYKIRHKELGYIRAVKEFTGEVNNKEEYEAFMKECGLLLRIGNGSHPNILHFYPPQLHEGHMYVVMDYIDGSTLNDYIRQQNHFIPWREVRRFIEEIGGALAYCHVDCYRDMMGSDEADLGEEELIRRYGVAHNDLHSNNIMRKKDGSYILVDFGLAIQGLEAVRASARGDGSVEYMAPEKWSDRPIANDKAVDVYGFGILMYEMLAGDVPFRLDQSEFLPGTEHALNDLRASHERAVPPPIGPQRHARFKAAFPKKSYKKDYPDWMEGIIMKCLEKNPEDRYQDAKELMDDFHAHLKKDEAHKGRPWKVAAAITGAVLAAGLIVAGVILGLKYIETLPPPVEIPPLTAEGIAMPAVDLGLSVKWAGHNLGAAGPEDSGAFIAWGEKEKKKWYIWKNYSLAENGDKMIRYNEHDGLKTLLREDDIAFARLGGTWRLPTEAEWKQLIDSCSWVWKTRGKVSGYEIRSRRTGGSIFLPAADKKGLDLSTVLNLSGEKNGYYWSSTRNRDLPSYARELVIGSGQHRITSEERYYGLTIRPVCEYEDTTSKRRIWFRN